MDFKSFESPFPPHTVQWWHPWHPLLHQRSHATPLVASLPVLAVAEDMPPNGSRPLPSPRHWQNGQSISQCLLSYSSPGVMKPFLQTLWLDS